MSDELDVIEQEPEVQYQMLPPAVEEILHNAGIEVRKVPLDALGNEMTLLRFHTPAKIYTVKMDDDGVRTLLTALRGGTAEILIARPGDVPNLRSG